MVGECLSRFYRIPHVITLMGQEAEGRHWYVRLLRSRRTHFVAVSQFQRRELLNRTGYDVHEVIAWGIEPPQIRGYGVRDIDVLGVGSLTDVKDFGTFLDVVALARQAFPNLVCRVAGDGPQREMLEGKLRRLGLERNVTFLGRIARERVFDLMHRSRVLLHTSTFESFGLVFAEASACGVQIVSRPVGIAEPALTWATCNEPTEMADALCRFLHAPNFIPRNLYTLEGTVSAYRNIYRETAEHSPSRSEARFARHLSKTYRDGRNI
jgi:glycosyltransferase involved in cell wall biosynthesis